MTDGDAPAAKKKEPQVADKTSSKTLEALLFAITDFANALESAVVNLRQNLKELSKLPEEELAEVYDALPWERREGSRGPFQAISRRSCGNSNLYRHLFNVVKVNTVNTGKFAHKIGEWLYWIDTRDTPTDPTAIYRRKKKPQNNETVDAMTFEGRRDRVTVRVKPQLKEALKRFCLANGLSICHVFETLVTGYLVGVNQKINLDVKRPTINLTVVRDVKRVRRYGTLSTDPRIEEVVEDSGGFNSCSLCDKRPIIVVFYYPSRSVCQRIFYCQDHWQEHKTRGSFDGYRRL